MKLFRSIFAFIIIISLTTVRVESQITPKSFRYLTVTDTLDLYNTEYDLVKTHADSVHVPLPATDNTVDDWYSNTSESFQISESSIVGDIPYTFDVSASGVSTVNIPLDGLSSASGFAPQLSLSYNSQSDAGPLGYGWGLAGISTITRCGKTYYYDGETTGTNNSKEFLLDGVRLIKDTEVNNYKSFQGNIKAQGFFIDDPFGVLSFFVVSYPDGKIARYAKNDGNTYYITNLTDLYGNEINYNYESVSGHYRIKNITYGNGAEIRFEYFSLVNGPGKFENGKGITYDYRLSMIKYFYKDKLKHTYILWYNTDTFQPDKYNKFIEKIDRTSGPAKPNSLQFYYGPRNSTTGEYTETERTLTPYLNYDNKNKIRAAKGKFIHGSDNDGLIMVANKITYYEKDASTLFKLKRHFYNQYDGNEDILIYSSLDHHIANNYDVLKTEAGFIDIFSMDVDDVKGEEIIKVNNYIEGTGDIRGDRVDIHVYANNPNYGIQKKYTRTYRFSNAINFNGSYSIVPKYYFTGDFNGDGKMELMVVTASKVLDGRGDSSKVAIIDLENDRILFNEFVFRYDVTFPSDVGPVSGETAYMWSDRIHIIDYNGDGKSDICHICSGEIKLYEFDKDFTKCSLVGSDSTIDRETYRSQEIYPGDFNGDMKTDLIITPKVNAGTQWSILLSKSNGTFERKSLDIEKRFGSSDYIIQDINLDGRTDILTQRDPGNGNWEYKTYFINDGPTVRISGSKASGDKLILAPLSGSYPDYDSESLMIGPDGYLRFITCNGQNDKNRMLSGIIDSKGVITKIKYDRVLNGSFYELINDAAFPYYNYAGGLWVCSGVRRYNNGTLLNDINYKYTNAIGHKHGFGFCGFKQIDQTDNITGKYLTRKFDPYRFGLMTYDLSDTEENTYTYSINYKPGHTVQALLTGKTSLDRINNNTVETTSTYDDYGNPLCTINTYGDEYRTEQHNKYLEISGSDKYIIGFPEEITDITYKGRQSTSTRTGFEYNSAFFPVRKTTGVNGDKIIKEETFQYDNLNNIIKHSFRDYNSEWLDEGFAYDGKEMISKTDPYGHTETYSYKLPSLIDRITDYKGYSTTFKYDSLYRKVETHHPDSLVERSRFVWVSEPAGALYMVENTATGRPDSRVYYNALGQDIRSGEMRFDGSYLYTDREYDIQGRMVRESLPFKTVPAEWNTYTYDNFNRVLSIVYSSGATDTYNYGHNKTTITSGGITSVRQYDRLGNLMSVQDPGGTITYYYRPDGQLSSIETSDGITTTFGYDEYYRQTSINDPSAGTKHFSYDKAGNVNLETDARGVSVTSTYDKYNRITHYEYGTQHTVDYTYNEDGKPLSIVAANGKRADYIYDGLSRLVSEQESINVTYLFKRTFQYGKGSVIDDITYEQKNGRIVGIENRKYTNGHLTCITLNDTIPVWRIKSENNRGLVTQVTTGPIYKNFTYDSQDNIKSRFSYLPAADIQYQTYEYSPLTGNILWRRDNMRTLPKEQFGYDNLNRLTSYAGNTVEYSANGNITSISNVGSFTYSSAKPYAITGATSEGGVIPLRSQIIKYNSQNLPDTILEVPYVCNFIYNGLGKRAEIKIDRNLRDRSYKLQRYYFCDCFEMEFLTKTYAYNTRRLYVGGDYYSAPAVYIQKNNKWALYYILRDNLGSITHITDSQGNVVQELSYDPWGNLRNPGTHELYPPDEEPELIIGRGFSGHEHLQQYRLINMNARLYDPALGRFLSPDPYVQMPDFTQNLNRFSYCLNNPLVYKDENGEFIQLLIGAAIGAGVNLAIDLINGDIHNFKDAMVSVGMGAVGGALTAINPYAGAAFMGVGGSIVKQGMKKGWDNIDFGQVAINGLTAVSTVGIASYMTPVVAPAMDKLVSGISSTYLRNAIADGLTYGATGFVTGFASGYVETGDPVSALRYGGTGALYGASTGIITGSVKAYKEIQALNKLENGSTGKSQTHHIISPKNKKYLDGFQEIADKYCLDLEGDWNKIKMSTEYHNGRHTNNYHDFVTRELQNIDRLANGSRSKFIYYFNLKVKQTIINDPKVIQRK